MYTFVLFLIIKFIIFHIKLLKIKMYIAIFQGLLGFLIDL